MSNIFDGAIIVSLDDIREHTEFNDHLEAYILGAELLREHDLKTKFEQYRDVRDAKSYLSCDESNAIYGLYQQLMSRAKAKLSENVYKEFYMSF